MTVTEHQNHPPRTGPRASETARLDDLARSRLLDTPPEERFDRITRLAQALFGVSAASISLIDEKRQFLKSFVGPLSRESERRDTFCTETIKSSDALVVENAVTDDRFRHSPLVTGDPHIKFYAGRPLTGPGGTHVGTFCIIDQSPRTFSEEQHKVLEDLTAIIQREMNLSWDIDYGARMQRALRPADPPAPAGYALGTCFYPAHGLSGDFYDLGTTPEGLFRLTVGDAMGKGVGPGLVAGAVHTAFAATGWQDGPAATLHAAAAGVEEKLGRAGSYATAFHAVVDPQTGEGRYADAGQGLSHILRADGTLERLATTGPPLGLMPGQSWGTGSFRLGPGDGLLVATDGLLDLHGGDLDRLAGVLGGRASGTSPDAAVKGWCDRRGKTGILDDITAVLLQRYSPAA